MADETTVEENSSISSDFGRDELIQSDRDLENDLFDIFSEIMDEKEEEEDNFEEEDESEEDDEEEEEEEEGEEDEDGDEDESDDDSDDEKDGDDAEDEQKYQSDDKKKPSKNAQERIKELNRKWREEEKARKELENKLQNMEKLQNASAQKYENPEEEIAKLEEQYRTLKTPQMIVEEQMINPDTGEPYNYAEAAAAIANARQDIQFKINDANSEVVRNMQLARESEQNQNKLVVPMQALVDKYPQLDPDSKKANPTMINAMQQFVNANIVKQGDFIIGFEKDPAEFVGEFENLIEEMSGLRANKQKKADKNVDKLPKTGAKASRSKKTTPKEEEDVQKMLDYLDVEINQNSW